MANASTFQLNLYLTSILFIGWWTANYRERFSTKILLPLLGLFLNSWYKRKLITCAKKCFRKATEVTRLGRLRTDDISSRINITSCIEYTETANTMVWISIRLEHNQLPTSPYNKIRSGYIARGIPRKKSIDKITYIINKHGHNATDRRHIYPSFNNFHPYAWWHFWTSSTIIHLEQDTDNNCCTCNTGRDVLWRHWRSFGLLALYSQGLRVLCYPR